jgi:hypothetical protein
MSKQIGLIKVKGSLDGVSFYQSKGENFARMAKGPDKNRILTDPAFKRTRENNSEFAGSAGAAKACRDALLPVLKTADNRLTSRTLKLLRSVHVKGKGIRGQRPIDISLHKEMLVNLDLNEKASLSSIFKRKIEQELTTSPERTTATLALQNFNVEQELTHALGATHFRFVLAIGTVSDFAFNKESNRFEPVEPKLNGLNAIAYSEYFSLDTPGLLNANVQATLANNPVLTDKVSLIQSMGIIFYQQGGDVFYPLKQGNAVKIIAVS